MTFVKSASRSRKEPIWEVCYEGSRILGEVEVMEQEGYGELEVDSRDDPPLSA